MKRRQFLQGDDAIEVGLPGEIDDCHPAAADLTDDVVSPERTRTSGTERSPVAIQTSCSSVLSERGCVDERGRDRSADEDFGATLTAVVLSFAGGAVAPEVGLAQNPTATLTVTPHPGGTITSDDKLINCGSDCSETYNLDGSESVTLTATAKPGWKFDSWSGCTATQGTQCTVRFSSNVTVTASFSCSTCTLIVTRAGGGNGNVTGSGISCPQDCSQTYGSGTSVTAHGLPGRRFGFRRLERRLWWAQSDVHGCHDEPIATSRRASAPPEGRRHLRRHLGRRRPVHRRRRGLLHHRGGRRRPARLPRRPASAPAAVGEPATAGDRGSEGRSAAAAAASTVQPVIVKIDGNGNVTSSVGARTLSSASAPKSINCGVSGFDCSARSRPARSSR